MSHGSSPSAWASITLALIGFVVGGIALIPSPNWTIFTIGVVLVVAYGFCPFNLLTGLYCPGCGGLRSTHELTNGDIAKAIDLNAFATVLVVSAIGWWAVWSVLRIRGSARKYFDLPMWAIVLLSFAALVFMVARNLPFGAALAP